MTASGARRAPLAGRQAGEGEQPVTGFLQAVGDRPALQPQLAQEGLAPFLHLFRGFGVDHVGIVGGKLLMQMVGSVRARAGSDACVVRAAPGRHLRPQRRQRLLQTGGAVHDQGLGWSSSWRDLLRRFHPLAVVLATSGDYATLTFLPSLRPGYVRSRFFDAKSQLMMRSTTAST